LDVFEIGASDMEECLFFQHHVVLVTRVLGECYPQIHVNGVRGGVHRYDGKRRILFDTFSVPLHPIDRHHGLGYTGNLPRGKGYLGPFLVQKKGDPVAGIAIPDVLFKVLGSSRDPCLVKAKVVVGVKPEGRRTLFRRIVHFGIDKMEGGKMDKSHFFRIVLGGNYQRPQQRVVIGRCLLFRAPVVMQRKRGGRIL
jgi:hypothetical protein